MRSALISVLFTISTFAQPAPVTTPPQVDGGTLVGPTDIALVLSDLQAHLQQALTLIAAFNNTVDSVPSATPLPPTITEVSTTSGVNLSTSLGVNASSVAGANAGQNLSVAPGTVSVAPSAAPIVPMTPPRAAVSTATSVGSAEFPVTLLTTRSLHIVQAEVERLLTALDIADRQTGFGAAAAGIGGVQTGSESGPVISPGQAIPSASQTPPGQLPPQRGLPPQPSRTLPPQPQLPPPPTLPPAGASGTGK